MTKRKRKNAKPTMMAFFDLNIPLITGESGKLSATKRKTRLKLVIKAMELGYTGIAYNHSIKGSGMSNSDICTISHISLSSILQSAPTISTSVKLHRELLDVPFTTPFQQFTRLTVAIDNLIQAAALNSGNPVLKSYDLVSVRPLNQSTFDQACKVAEVDLITIDFSEKMPFRMDFQTVKAAIKRGVYFEIEYSHLISDVHTRRQVIQNSKLLVEWSGGKNLIISSGAASVNELRGPCDVANLSSLLGLSTKRAKAAISKNCRFLLHSALRKKQYYKNAIKVERILSTKPADSKEAWFCDGNGMFSGEGHLVLEDIANISSAPSNVFKGSKPINFSAIAEEMASNGFSLMNCLSPRKVDLK